MYKGRLYRFWSDSFVVKYNWRKADIKGTGTLVYMFLFDNLPDNLPDKASPGETGSAS